MPQKIMRAHCAVIRPDHFKFVSYGPVTEDGTTNVWSPWLRCINMNLQKFISMHLNQGLHNNYQELMSGTKERQTTIH